MVIVMAPEATGDDVARSWRVVGRREARRS